MLTMCMTVNATELTVATVMLDLRAHPETAGPY